VTAALPALAALAIQTKTIGRVKRLLATRGAS
jgi:hypothetical protein